MEATTAWVTVFRDGSFTFEVELPVLVDEAGEEFVTLETALTWEHWQESMAMFTQASSRLSRKRRRWFGKAGSAIAPTATDTTSGTLAVPGALRYA